MWDPYSFSLRQVAQKKNINQVLQEPLQQPVVLTHQETRRKVGIDINEFQKITAMAGNLVSNTIFICVELSKKDLESYIEQAGKQELILWEKHTLIMFNVIMEGDDTGFLGKVTMVNHAIQCEMIRRNMQTARTSFTVVPNYIINF
jgi:hypothetical protein